MVWIAVATGLVLTAASAMIYGRNRRARQLAFIKTYPFHPALKAKLNAKYPQLSEEQTHLVFRALRDYFWMCNKAKRKLVAMPSQVVDDAWHEFILFTRAYQAFCGKALGRFLHHTPTEAMKTPTLAQDGIKRAWRLACARERLNPNDPGKLPLIFGIDALLEIPDGFVYVPNCRDPSSPGYGSGYCAGHIGCAGGCTGDSGAADAERGFFDGLFDGFNCGSDCGGGCGGD